MLQNIAQPRVNIRNIAFETDAGTRARLGVGLIVLGIDQTIEYEFRRILGQPGIGIYGARMKCGTVVSDAMLRESAEGIAETADLILPGIDLDVIAFGCTSATLLVGEDEIARRIHLTRPQVKVTTPVTAVRAAFEALKLRRLALLTPYPEEINQKLREFLLRQGIEVPVMGSFNEPDDLIAARIRTDILRDAAIRLGQEPDVDAVFVSCTSMRVVDVADEIETSIGKPVIASNQAMAWHCLRLGGIADPLQGFGRLLRVSTHV